MPSSELGVQAVAPEVEMKYGLGAISLFEARAHCLTERLAPFSNLLSVMMTRWWMIRFHFAARAKRVVARRAGRSEVYFISTAGYAITTANRLSSACNFDTVTS